MTNNKDNNSENYNKIVENENEDNKDSKNNETNTNINYNTIITSWLTQGSKGKNGWSAKDIKLYNNMFAKVVAVQKNNGKAFDISFRKNCRNKMKYYLPVRTDNENVDLMPTAANCL